MVATNRLTGHSPGFFSVYTLPPNQAVTAARQMRINAKLGQRPEYRDVRLIIEKKTKALLGRLGDAERARLSVAGATARFLTGDARATPEIADASVALTVTSPPFLDVVQYSDDNWLRCWFNALPLADSEARLTMARTVVQWSEVMQAVFAELYRITRSGGHVAFEVGEVRKGTVKLEAHVVPLGERAGFACAAVLVNRQRFTKTSHIWGIANNRGGTNSNRIVLFRKP
jgi:hypothetical protein